MKKHLYLSMVLALAACGKKTGTGMSEQQSNSEAYGEPSRIASKYKVNSLSETSFVPDRIFFNFDSDVLTNDAKEVISQQYAFLSKSTKNIIIEGHSDIRGTAEYNLALGLKRANAVKKELQKMGYKGKITTVTFGKQKVAVPGNSSEAHAQNRRGVVVIK